MNAPQMRQRPTCEAGREVAKQIELARELYGTAPADSTSARAGYHGMRRQQEVPAPREPLTISRELYAAAECLADLAEDFAAGGYDARVLSSADALLIGCGRLVCELRARRAREAA